MNAVLQNLGLTLDQVRATWWPKPGVFYGRRGYPAAYVQTLYADYLRLGSTHKVAKLYRRSAQSVWELFHYHGLAMQTSAREIARTRDRLTFEGRDYIWVTRHDRGHTWSHWRGTTGGREPLCREMWKALRGPIPAGQQVSFLNGDSKDARIENLFCAPKAEITRHHLRRLHPEWAFLSPDERHARRKKIGLAFYYRKRAAFWQAGRRCDGKERRRPKGSALRTPHSALVSRVKRGSVEEMWREFRAAHGSETTDMNADQKP